MAFRRYIIHEDFFLLFTALVMQKHHQFIAAVEAWLRSLIQKNHHKIPITHSESSDGI